MTTIKRRRVPRTWAGLALAGVMLLGAACGGDDDSSGDSSDTTAASGGDTTAPSSEQVTIDYFTFSAAPDHLTDLDAIVTAFETENPNIKIEVQTAAYADYFTALQTQVGGGSAPDTFELNYESFVTYQASDALLDLTPYTTDGTVDPARYYPLALEGFQADGTQYGLPATFSDVVLIYNKALFDAAGLAYPTADWTWADEQTAAAKLTDTAAGVYGDYQPVSFFEFYKALAQAGGSFFGPDGKPTFNSAEGVKAAEWLTGKPGTTMPTLADIGGTPDFDTALFTSGKLAMWHNGIWQFTGLNEAGVDYDVVVEPGDTQKASAVFMNAAVASAKTDHPAEAAKWIAFLTGSPTTVQTRLASSWELPAVNDQTAFADYLAVEQPANREAVFDSLDHIALPPAIERQQEMQDTVTEALEAISTGGADPQDALDDAASKVDKLLG